MTEGIWDQFTADKYHQSSPKLAAWLAAHLPKNQIVIDFGCGNGFYCCELNKAGFGAMGIEGFELNNFLFDNIVISDLTEPINLPYKGSVISLEVGEHIAKEYEQTFIDNVTSNCDGMLVLSWALPGQPGIGHINCQPKEYIVEQIESRGFILLEPMTMEARENIDDNTDWFRRTLLVFARS